MFSHCLTTRFFSTQFLCWRMLLVTALVVVLALSLELTTVETLNNVKILALLRDFGQAKTNALNAEITDPNKRFSQYLVVTMLTGTEFQDSQSWGANHVNMLLAENRIQYYRNEKKGDRVGFFKKGETIHGELLFLYIEGDNVGKLAEKLPDDGSKEKPHLLMFSFYIPCACVSKCDFNCAEELKSSAKVHQEKYKFIVGFEDIFSETDEKASQTFIRDGGIELYRYLNQEFNLVQIIPGTTIEKEQMFQTVLSQLLLKNKHLVECLPSDITKRSIIAASFIKHIISLGIATDKTLQMLPVELTKFSRAWLHRTLSEDVLSTVMDNDCPKKNKRRPLLVSCSIKSALQQSTHIGHPKTNTLDQFEFFYSGTLSRILDIPCRLLPAEIQCVPSNLAPESLCTKSKLPTNKEKTLMNERKPSLGESSKSRMQM